MTEALYESPIGILKIIEEDGFITRLCMAAEEDIKNCSKDSTIQIICDTKNELSEYFAGKRKSFSVPLKLRGTAFQKMVWDALLEIPYGEVRSYKDVAKRIESPGAVRAVGQANHNNPVMIIVPCHRVIHKNGDISGYGYGLDIKKYLLELEGCL